eukprot:CAMPEP_0180185246 /NCGR_PEP_ID=MMETSP0986-20121125/42282_1 /TAXON_ID=697907 /ORGANISM="non described non described, Strain CCMP2293" /LENGTH=454 /DNA_ID=CAMNT_0022139039 /DNA_START=30 /DNA_END=1394 /DNA_ORIENTATION=+
MAASQMRRGMAMDQHMWAMGASTPQHYGMAVPQTNAAASKFLTIFPRRKAGQLKRDTDNTLPVQLTLQMLHEIAHIPLIAAAKKLGISKTALKNACRSLGLERWPFRRNVQTAKRRSMNGGDDGKDSAWDEDDDDEDDDDDEPRSTSAAPVRNDMAFLHHPTHPEGAHPGQPGYDQVMMPAHATMREMALHQHKMSAHAQTALPGNLPVAPAPPRGALGRAPVCRGVLRAVAAQRLPGARQGGRAGGECPAQRRAAQGHYSSSHSHGKKRASSEGSGSSPPRSDTSGELDEDNSGSATPSGRDAGLDSTTSSATTVPRRGGPQRMVGRDALMAVGGPAAVAESRAQYEAHARMMLMAGRGHVKGWGAEGDREGSNASGNTSSDNTSPRLEESKGSDDGSDDGSEKSASREVGHRRTSPAAHDEYAGWWGSMAMENEMESKPREEDGLMGEDRVG